jgi:hypothetical protein
VVKVRTLVRILHAERERSAPREYGAGQLVEIGREWGLRWYVLGIAELVDYVPSRGELLEAARAALPTLELEAAQMGRGDLERGSEEWERVPANRRRAERLLRMLAPEAPKEIA